MKISKILATGIVAASMCIMSAVAASASFDPNSLISDTPAETTAAAGSFDPTGLIGGDTTGGDTTTPSDNPILTSDGTTTGGTPTAGDTAAPTNSSKGSPDTGVEDLAPLAGVALVSAGIIFATKKRRR